MKNVFNDDSSDESDNGLDEKNLKVRQNNFLSK